MPLTMSLFNYPKLKHTKRVAVVGLNNLMQTAEPSWSPVNKHLAKLYSPITKFPFSSAFFSILQELTLLLLLYRGQWNTYVFFSIYPASAHYSIHLLKKNLFIFCLLTTPTKNSKNHEQHDALKMATFLKCAMKYYFLVLVSLASYFQAFPYNTQRQKFSLKVKKKKLKVRF